MTPDERKVLETAQKIILVVDDQYTDPVERMGAVLVALSVVYDRDFKESSFGMAKILQWLSMKHNPQFSGVIREISTRLVEKIAELNKSTTSETKKETLN